MPLVGFYFVIPFFIIALHFNFLQNFESHHNKLMRWQEAHPDGKVPHTSIRPFLFDFAVLEKEGQMLRLVRIANSLLCYNFAPITLGLLLIRYSDSQDWPVTVFHYIAFVFDVWLVWKLRLALKDNAQSQPSSPTVPTIRGFIRDIPSAELRGGFGLFVLMVTLTTVSIGATSNDFFVAHVQHIVQMVTQAHSVLNDENHPAAKPIGWLLPRIAINPTETVWKPDEKAFQTEAKLAHFQDDWVAYFDQHGKGLLLISRSLRFAELPQQNLRKAQLVNAKLQGADLGEAKLQVADLELAELQGAFFYSTQIVGIRNPSEATVFNVAALTDKSNSMFNDTKRGSNDLKELDAIAKSIPDEETRMAYQERIKRTIDLPSYDAKKVWRPDNSPRLVQEVLNELCKVQSGDQPSRLAAAQGFRENFNSLSNWPVELQNNPEYQKLLLALDTTLCTLEACKDLRDDIEGLDCTKVATK